MPLGNNGQAEAENGEVQRLQLSGRARWIQPSDLRGGRASFLAGQFAFLGPGELVVQRANSMLDRQAG